MRTCLLLILLTTESPRRVVRVGIVDLGLPEPHGVGPDDLLGLGSREAIGLMIHDSHRHERLPARNGGAMIHSGELRASPRSQA